MLSLAVAGSVMVPRNVRQSGYDRDNGTYAYNTIFDDVQALFGKADLSICTVESAFTGQDYTDYNAPDAMLDALKYAGFDMLSLGNEHALT
jgi:poly-gamma-glutamate synthesis protein (capsule biosynthesis protein)